MLLGHGERSLFSSKKQSSSRSTREERDILRSICDEFRLDEYYYEAAMDLWMKLKSDYECLCFAYGSQRYLAICLGLAIKWAGPKSQAHAYCTLRNMRRYWPYLTLERLQSEELKMCVSLEWKFR